MLTTCARARGQFASRERAHAYAPTHMRPSPSPRVARVNPTGSVKPPWVKGALSARYPKRGNSVWLGGPRCRQVRGPPAAPHQVISYDVPSSQGGAEAHGDAPQTALARMNMRTQVCNAHAYAHTRTYRRMHMRTHICACICAHTYAHAYAGRVRSLSGFLKFQTPPFVTKFRSRLRHFLNG